MGLEFDEVARFRKVLAKDLRMVMESTEPDSPVYVSLSNAPADLSAQEHGPGPPMTPPGLTTPVGSTHTEHGSVVVGQIAEAVGKGNFAVAGALLVAMGKERQDAQRSQRDALALRTAAGWLDAPESSRRDVLEQIRRLLADLQPATTNDPEILALWAEVHARLWEQAGERKSLDTAIATYDRVFTLRGDFATGGELARLLYTRAPLQQGDEQTATSCSPSA